MAFFNYIVSLSIRACVFIPLVIAIRYLISKFPKKYSYALWLMVFAGLVVKISVPGTIDTPISQAQHTMQQQYNSVLCSYTEDITVHNDNTEEYSRALQQGIEPIISEEAKYVITSAESIAPPETVESSVMPAVMLVWFGGVLVLLLLYVKNVVNILSMLRFAVHYKYDIYYSEYVNSPFVFGIIKPKIYLPCSITKQQAEAVIRHERVHIKRLDYLVKPLCFFITVLHWFNPFVWVAFYLMCRDMEHSCDEAVIKYSDIQDKKEYCDALLQFALKDKDYRIGTVMFGESDCSSRIKNVLGFKNPKRIVSALLVIIVAVVAVLAVTEEKQTEQPANQFAEMTFAQLEEYKKGELLQSDNDLNERLQILQAMDKRQDSEIADYIANEIAEYCKKDNFVKFKDVTVTQDNLTLVYNEAQKPLCNSEIKISLELYPYTDADIKAQAENYCKELYRYLCGEYSGEQFVPNLDFVAYKTKQFAVEIYSENGEHIASYEAGENNSFENPQLLQKSTVKMQNLPETEQYALDKAFDYGKGHNNFILKKFGIDSDNRLYLEYTFSDDWLLMGDGTAEEKIAAKTAQLNDIYADITEKVINHKDVQQYIAENNVGTAVVAFSHRFLKNEIVEFNLIVNKEAPHFTHDFETEDSLPAKTEYITVATSYFRNSMIIGDSIADGLRIYENIENSISESAQFETYKNMTPDVFMNEIEDLSGKTSFEKVVGASPKQIYVLMGTNALSFVSESRFIADYGMMINQLKEKLPNTAIYICSIPPVSEEYAENATVYEKDNLHIINLELQIMATLDNVYYLDLHEILADTNGYLREDFVCSDGIHLEPTVYKYIVDYLRERIVPVQNYQTDAQQTESGLVIGWPTAGGVRISRGFTGQYPAHDGVDIAGPYGTEIYAAADGVVVAAEHTTDGDGIYVTVQHKNGWLTHYAHCCGLYVEKGDTVIREQLIARMGCTGNSTGNHLHFEIIDENGTSLDPYRYW